MVTTKKQKQATTLTGLFLFLHLLLIPPTFLICATAATATATDRYTVVSDSEVPLRDGQGAKHKILTHLQNEETVTALEDAGVWIKIRTATGSEGWMPKQYLSSTPSIDDAFTLPTKNDQTSEQPAPPAKPIPSGEQNIHAPQPEAQVPQKKTEPLQSKITNSLPTEQTLNEPGTEANESAEELRNKLAAVTLENKELRENERIKWFLAGGGVLVCGWLIGLITCRSRKRKLSLL
ncbi:MAG: TIGR04211 family SH3 domain-containing protein [Deltaproteobacteria bacterium]|nr:TIGR04211 family SH3 domain-containing protein [Deltaproteobacteria bacterium]